MMEDLKNFNWSNFYSCRRMILNQYPNVYNLKIRKKLKDIVFEELRDGDKILDVGAYDRGLEKNITNKFPTIIYKSMDIDKNNPHDYYSLDEISESFDLIIFSQVIEHLEFKEGILVLKKLFQLLNEGGKIIVSTPNIHHPNRYWDSDHKTPYRYDELGGILFFIGFKIEKIYRIYNAPFLQRFFRIYIASYLHEYLDVDFAKSIIIVAVKK